MHLYSDSSIRTIARTPEEQLEAELRRERELNAALTDRLLAMQTASEGADRVAQSAVRGVAFDWRRPFGHMTERCFDTPGQKAAWRLIKRSDERDHNQERTHA